MVHVKKLSRLTLVLFAFVGLIVATAGLIGYVSLHNGTLAVQDVVEQLQEQMFVSIREKLSDYLAMPHRINRLNAELAAQNPAMLDDLEAWHPVYLRELHAFETISFVGAGVEQHGDFVGAGRRGENFSINLLQREQDPTYRAFEIDSQGQRIQGLFETPDYDPRPRAWYRSAVQAGKAAWSPIYVWATGLDVGITAVLPVYDPDGNLSAVHQTVLTLDFITAFLKGLNIGKSGQAFLMEQDGMLVASSTAEKVLRQGAENFERFSASDSTDPFIHEAAGHLIDQFGELGRLPDTYNSKLVIEGQRYFISAATLRDPYGLRWSMVIGLPEIDVMAQIAVNTRTTIVLCLVALLIAIGLSIIMARLLTEAHQRLEAEIDERKRTETALQEAKELAENANHAKSAFLSNISHELRTPLNGILGYAQILGKHQELGGIARDGLNIIHQSGLHLLTLINDILDLAKIEARKLEVYPEELHLSEFLDGVAGIIRMRAQEKNVRFVAERDPRLPVGILADEKRLRQVLLNLLGNAVKFTPSGGTVTFEIVDLRLQISDDESFGSTSQKSKSKIAHLKFQISDTGVGMTAEQLQTIFSPFEQVGDLSRRAEGTGLGLAISKQLVELMGGTIQVTSTAGQGSTFWFEAAFPVEEGSMTKQSEVQGQVVGYEAERQLKLLVVDDREEIRVMLRRLLEPLGFDVTLAENGQEGVAKAQSIHPDGILMDLMMPVMTGFEAVQTLRQQPDFQQTPIIAMSASVFDMNQEQSRVAGCDVFVPKPIDAEKLFDILARLLSFSWQYADEPFTPPTPESGAAIEMLPPPQADLEAIYELAVLGKIFEIQEYVEGLEIQNALYQPFARKVWNWAQAFEDRQIAAFVKHYLENMI